MADKTITRTSRVTTTTYVIANADPMWLWCRPMSGILGFSGTHMIVPFEVDGTWTDGTIDSIVTVRGWIMKDGAPTRVAVARVDPAIVDGWFFALFRNLSEPGVPTADPPPVAEAPSAAVTGQGVQA